MASEQWLQIKKHPNYEVSDWGRVREKGTHKTIKPYLLQGKRIVTLNGMARTVKVLVMRTFNPIDKDMVVKSRMGSDMLCDLYYAHRREGIKKEEEMYAEC